MHGCFKIIGSKTLQGPNRFFYEVLIKYLSIRRTSLFSGSGHLTEGHSKKINPFLSGQTA